jgi:hypothetical protein
MEYVHENELRSICTSGLTLPQRSSMKVHESQLCSHDWWLRWHLNRTEIRAAYSDVFHHFRYLLVTLPLRILR